MGCYKLSYYRYKSTEIVLKSEGLEADFEKNCANSYRYGFNGMEKETDISEGDYTTSYRLLDSRLGRWFSIDPRFDKFSWQSPYVSMDNNPIYLKDPLGDSTFVSKLSEGKYKVIGGSLKGDDNGIYVQDANGKIGELLGYTATPMSFYNADANKWMGTITTGDQGGKNFLNKLLAENPDLVTYCSNATGGKKYDFKRTNGTTTTYYNTDETYYRGMPILGTVNGKQIYASARDVGNIGAGIVAGRNGLGWENGRIGFDALESYQQKVFTSESKSTQYAEKLGHNIGSAMYQKMELGRLPGNGHLMHIKIPNTFIKKGSL